MNVFELEIVCERDQRCIRRVEFLASQTLWDVHRCIQREFDLDNDHIWSFYLSGEYHDPEYPFRGQSPNRQAALGSGMTWSRPGSSDGAGWPSREAWTA